MVGLDKKGTGEDRRQGQIPEGGDSGRETEWVDQQQRRKVVSRGLSGWALVDSALPSDDAHMEPHASFPGQ